MGSLSPGSFGMCHSEPVHLLHLEYIGLEDTGFVQTLRFHCLYNLYNQCQIIRSSFLKGKTSHKRWLYFHLLVWKFLTSEASAWEWHDLACGFLSRQQVERHITAVVLDLRHSYVTLSKAELETLVWLQFHICFPIPKLWFGLKE